jgi:hypothetical protein
MRGLIDVGTVANCICEMRGDRSLVALCEAHGLPASDAPALSRILRGEAVSVATLRRIGRALGCVPQPRRLIRRVLTPQEAAAWDALAPPERLRRLTQ